MLTLPGTSSHREMFDGKGGIMSNGTGQPRNWSDFSRTVDIFYKYFDVIPADTPELLNEVFSLRYQVYCLETKFEDVSRFPEKLEKDVFDEHSVHSLIVHKRTGINAGSVRLVLPVQNYESCFPVQEISQEPLFKGEPYPIHSCAEVSRFAISKEFRRRFAEFQSPSSAGHPYLEKSIEDERRILPHLTLGLFAGMLRMSISNNIENWFCVMEPALLRLLSRCALYFKPSGELVNYHGKRQPCYANIQEFLGNVRNERPDIYEVITQDGKIQYN